MSGHDCVQRVRKTAPPDQIKTLSYGLHPDGCINPHEAPSMMTEYQSKFSTFKLVTPENTPEESELFRSEKSRLISLMDKRWSVQQRSYTNPYDSYFPVKRSKAAEPLIDRSREVDRKHFKMNGRSEYQAIYDREEYKEMESFFDGKLND